MFSDQKILPIFLLWIILLGWNKVAYQKSVSCGNMPKNLPVIITVFIPLPILTYPHTRYVKYAEYSVTTTHHPSHTGEHYNHYNHSPPPLHPPVHCKLSLLWSTRPLLLYGRHPTRPMVVAGIQTHTYRMVAVQIMGRRTERIICKMDQVLCGWWLVLLVK